MQVKFAKGINHCLKAILLVLIASPEFGIFSQTAGQTRTNKFPHLKSASEPLGPVEQVAVAITVDPREEAAPSSELTWFGRMLATEGFVWRYINGSQREEVNGKKAFADLYFNNSLRYTVYERKCLGLALKSENEGVVDGEVTVKGQYQGADHSGKYSVHYVIARELVGNDMRWRVREWTQTKLPQ